MSNYREEPVAQNLIFLRHGATEANLAGLRCGGDRDLPLTELGRRQVSEAAMALRAQGLSFGLIVSSDLLRTRESAEIIARTAPGVPVLIEPAFAERRLGAWNLQAIADTEAALASGATLPGGESSADFVQRIAGALQVLLPHLGQRPLLVGSKGVARALRVLLGKTHRHGLANAEVMQFDLAGFARQYANGCEA